MRLARGNFTTRKGVRELSHATGRHRIGSQTISRADSPEGSRGKCHFAVKSPLRNGQTARLAWIYLASVLKQGGHQTFSNRGHTAPVGNVAGLYGCASGRATRSR